MKKCLNNMACLAGAVGLLIVSGCGDRVDDGYVGSKSCKECHERFYKLWESSHHGKAMQPYSDEFAEAKLTAQVGEIAIGDVRFKADISAGEGYVVETGPDGKKKYPIEHAMGGKNVYFFLTTMARGRLQVMPISYNVKSRDWYDTTASMVRHLGLEEDEAVHWTDSMLTFNTACFNCHVSQLRKNYDLKSDTYTTVWGEPGINCETCHGPSGEHISAAREAKGGVLSDLKLLDWKTLSPEQRSDACSGCHGKAAPITAAFNPGDKFFDHYDLTCFEDRDFYPDGRDLGENYTLTGWMMSQCVKQGKLDCIHCHTSSGRYRFKTENPNDACLPCHKARVGDIAAHSHHEVDKEGAPTCVSCHMPLTTFGRMDRSDHSMRPPSGEASMKFKSPNACNLCHKEKGAEWVAGKIEKWHPAGKWKGRIAHEGQLVQWARAEKWENLPHILGYVQSDTADDIVVVSLLRLLSPCTDARVAPVLRNMLAHSSPLVRATAATTMGCRDLDSVRALLPLLDDEYRLVRIRVANELLAYPRDRMPLDYRSKFEAAEKELLGSMTCRPDHWGSHYNLGNYWGQLGQTDESLESYNLAIKLRPDVILPYVNASIAASQVGDGETAYRYLQKAYELEPKNAAVNMNLGLLLAERGDTAQAEKHLREAFLDSRTMPQAAYNLAVIIGTKDPAEAAKLCRRALKAVPGDRKYQQALTYYMSQVAE